MRRAWGAALVLAAAAAVGQAPQGTEAAATALSADRTRPATPGAAGRLHARDLGLVINTNDPYSVAVGAHYIAARGLAPHQVLRLELPLVPVLDRDAFTQLQARIAEHFDDRTQALALAWQQPYAVACNSITGALTLGFDAALCSDSCAPSRRSPYFDSPSLRPFTDLHLRPTMLLAAPDAQAARALIDRGVLADHTLGLRGAPPVHAFYLRTSDPARNVRVKSYPVPGFVPQIGVNVHVSTADALRSAEPVLLYMTGLPRVAGLDRVNWVPGALADHLTSFGGRLSGDSGQMSVLDWIGSGATASYGTVSEPCAHPQKFPHPRIVLKHYVQGGTAIEAYWKSVRWPQQGLFVGEPLAAPFARD